MTRAKWSAERERVYRAAMRWWKLCDRRWLYDEYLTVVRSNDTQQLANACAAAAKAKRGKR